MGDVMLNYGNEGLDRSTFIHLAEYKTKQFSPRFCSKKEKSVLSNKH